MFKKKVPFFRGVKRKTENESDDDSDLSSSDDETVVVKKDRKNTLNPLVQSTSSFNRKREKFHKKTDSNEDSDDHRESISVVYKSDRNAESVLPKDMGATAIVEIDTAKNYDHESSESMTSHTAKYTLPQKDNLGKAAAELLRPGPIRAPENLRATIRWDYQPDVCKDYKETGFCGFGLSCKFLHDRSDCKHGWQIEREVQNGTYNKEDEEDYEIKEEESLPFKCLKCRKSFKNPVVTKCKHYFCESCALEYYRKSTQCYVCRAPTQGIFNPAKELIKMLENAKDDEESESDDNKNRNKDEQDSEDEDDE